MMWDKSKGFILVLQLVFYNCDFLTVATGKADISYSYTVALES